MRILVVEDDHVSRTLLTHLLAPYGEVATAVDGSEALGGSRTLTATARPSISSASTS